MSQMQTDAATPLVAADDPEFEVQMKSLAEEAEQFLCGSDPARGERGKPSQPSLVEFLRPLVQHMETLGRVMTENTMAVARLEEAASAQAARLEEAAGAQTSVPRLFSSLHESIDQKNKLNDKLFSALHEELRGYKEELLLEIFHRPIARDLIMFYDDLSELLRHGKTLVCGPHRHDEKSGDFFGGEKKAERTCSERVHNFVTGLDHTIHALLEVLARMQVQRLSPSSGRLDKQKHRVIAVEAASASEEDLQIVASVKPGFVWRGRLLRPEEVIIKRWKGPSNGALMPLHSSASAPAP